MWIFHWSLTLINQTVYNSLLELNQFYIFKWFKERDQYSFLNLCEVKNNKSCRKTNNSAINSYYKNAVNSLPILTWNFWTLHKAYAKLCWLLSSLPHSFHLCLHSCSLFPSHFCSLPLSIFFSLPSPFSFPPPKISRPFQPPPFLPILFFRPPLPKLLGCKVRDTAADLLYINLPRVWWSVKLIHNWYFYQAIPLIRLFLFIAHSFKICKSAILF